MKRIVCCHPVNSLRLTVARPHTVIALTQLNKASMYETLYLPLLAKNIAEKMRGVNVLEEKY
jgi:hypothetical protein